MKSNIIEKVPYAKCCGCGACYNICPKLAITMQENDEGFLVPRIDESKCITCGLCLKVCPTLQEKRQNAAEPVCYAAQAPDSIRSISSSGGVFTLIAEEIINRGGSVCGAAFREDWSVHHIIINNKEDLAKLRGSKYVQSDTEDCYKRIKALLREKKWVLFSGTPCQVAGLYTYLGKDYDTLLTVDIFCHGSPSPGVWKRYLRENYKLDDIVNVNFRDKTAIGWSCSHVAITKRDGTKDVCNNYTKWFHHDVIMRLSCQDCKFNKLPRPGDISAGDWWGISKVAPEVNDGKGLSNVLLNSEKGDSFYESLSGFAKSHNVALPSDYNNSLMRKGLFLSRERPYFFAENYPLNTHKKMQDAMRRYYDVCYVSNFYAKNHGSMLVHFAGYKILEMLGFSVLVLNRPAPVLPREHEEHQNIIPYAFAQRHYRHITPVFKNLAEITCLNSCCSSFVLGGDNLLEYQSNMSMLAFLQFAHNDKLKIAFGTSFGHSEYPANEEKLFRDKLHLQRFNHLALRETPNNLINNLFEVKATQVIDPTLVLPIKYYHKLADLAASLNLDKPYLLTYIFELDEEKAAAIKHVANKLGLHIINIPNANSAKWKHHLFDLKVDKNYAPEEFVRLFKEADFVITDAFHGACFSLLFQKKFISLVKYSPNFLRYNIFEKCGLLHRFYATASDVLNSDDWMNEVDYTQAHAIISKESKFAIRWLKRALWKVKWMRISHKLRSAIRNVRKKFDKKQ